MSPGVKPDGAPPDDLVEWVVRRTGAVAQSRVGPFRVPHSAIRIPYFEVDAAGFSLSPQQVRLTTKTGQRVQGSPTATPRETSGRSRSSKASCK